MVHRLINWFIKLRWIEQIIILLILGLGISCVTIWYIETVQFFAPISERLDVENWDEFHAYMDKTFVIGMPREDVYKELDKFNEYKITPTKWRDENEFCELIGLPTGNPIVFSKLQYIACYSLGKNTLTMWNPVD